MNSATEICLKRYEPEDGDTKWINRLSEWYEQSFPAEERRDTAWWLQLAARQPAFELYMICLGQNSEPCGFISLWRLPHALYGEHFVIDPWLRNSGVGSHVVRKLSEQISVNENYPFVLEAEPADANDMSARRLQFYRRLGFIDLPYAYIQPKYDCAGEYAIPLVLMSSHFLSMEVFVRVVEEIRHHVYYQPLELIIH